MLSMCVRHIGKWVRAEKQHGLSRDTNLEAVEVRDREGFPLCLFRSRGKGSGRRAVSTSRMASCELETSGSIDSICSVPITVQALELLLRDL
jgi:hypothetical protein